MERIVTVTSQMRGKFLSAPARHSACTSSVMTSRLGKSNRLPSTSSIRFSGDSSARTDQKCETGSNARLMRTQSATPVAGQLRPAYQNGVSPPLFSTFRLAQRPARTSRAFTKGPEQIACLAAVKQDQSSARDNQAHRRRAGSGSIR